MTSDPNYAVPMRMPVVFIPHGGGPWPFVDTGFPPEDVEDLKRVSARGADGRPAPAACLARHLRALGGPSPDA